MPQFDMSDRWLYIHLTILLLTIASRVAEKTLETDMLSLTLRGKLNSSTAGRQFESSRGHGFSSISKTTAHYPECAGYFCTNMQ
jgi:hypothetical protein